MILPKHTLSILLGVVLFLFTSIAFSQTKQIKRPKSRVGISSVDRFVQESFDIYDKVYKYDGYTEAGTPLDDEDIDVLEDALDDLQGLSDSAPNILGDIEGESNVLRQGKATLQTNRAKKALKYSIKTAKKLLLEKREKKDDDEEDTSTSSDENTETNTSSSDKETKNTPTPQKEVGNVSDNLEIYSKFDFVPGDKLLFFDDFSNDFIGDFPSKWNTNATGEVVKIEGKGKWFQLKSGGNVYYLPEIDELPENYTIEFDLLTNGLTKRTTSTARLTVAINEENHFDSNSNYVKVSIPLALYASFSIDTRNRFANGSSNSIQSSIKADIRNAMLNQPHISISVTKNRFRLWVNEKKYVDIPKFVNQLNILKYLRFNLYGLEDGTENLYIANLKIAEGGVDLRRKLLSEGKVSTNAILFDSGKATIKPQSLGVVRQISQVLMQDDAIKLNIIGHTDADGSDAVNLKLSKLRAEAVKNALVEIYKISGNRLQTQGKGETEPISDNTTTNGKAQNRRVEFIKI